MPQILQDGELPSTALLNKFAARGAANRFLYQRAFGDVQFKLHDFDEDTIDLDYWAVANSGGTSAANFATQITGGTGIIRGDTGTSDNGSISIVGPIIYLGDNHAGMWCRFKVDDVTSANIELGFIDAVPGSNASGVSDVDTPAAAAADAALVTFDTDQTLTTWAAVTVGSTANQTVKATSMAGVPITNATYIDVTVQLVGNDAYFMLKEESGTNTAQGAAVAMHNNRSESANSAGHVEGGVALAPWFYARTRNTTAKFPDIDAWAIWSYRRTQ